MTATADATRGNGSDRARDGGDSTVVPANAPHAEARRRRAEATLEQVTLQEAAERRRCRELYGIVGQRRRVPFRAGLEASAGGRRLVHTVWALVAADAVVTATLPRIASAAQLTIGSAAPNVAVGLRPFAFPLGGMAGLLLLRRRPSRTQWAALAAVAQAVLLVATALSATAVETVLVALVLSAVSGALAAATLAVLIDASRPEIRMRVAGGFATAVVGGIGISGAVIAITSGVGLSWRAACLLLALLPAAAGAAALSITDPGVGRFDRDRIRRLVAERVGAVDVGDEASTTTNFDMQLGARLARVVSTASGVRLLLCAAGFGIVAWGVAPELGTFLRDRWAVVAPARSLLLAATFLAAVPGTIWAAARLEAAFAESPRALVWQLAEAGSIAAVALAGLAVSPFFTVTVILLVVLFTAAAVLLAGAAFLLTTVVDPALRDAAAVALLTAVLLGGIVGQQLGGSIGTRFGIVWALVVTALVLLGWVSPTAALRTIEHDLDATLGRLVEMHELSTRQALGQHLPLLACKHVDFSYGQVQVLFDVSFTVDDGEMVALLGTNGAGKTTLLRLISGLAIPSAGSVHFRGRDVTFLGPDQRVDLGISQIPGGRAVFGALTVLDNLRAYGYTYGRRRSDLNRAIDGAFDALPRLYERRDQLASTLSGGEQQMLGVAKAFITRPRLLLIDELSLGLAPKVVSDLLDMVRRINATGTAVVLVEQSANIALGLVEHAYFMEKGEMRFDGPAQSILDRPDLLRSVFLEGATKGLGER